MNPTSFAPVVDLGNVLTNESGPELAVTFMDYDSDTGWAIEIARQGQFTDGGPAPDPRDLPADVREHLISWLLQGRTA